MKKIIFCLLLMSVASASEGFKNQSFVRIDSLGVRPCFEIFSKGGTESGFIGTNINPNENLLTIGYTFTGWGSRIGIALNEKNAIGGSKKVEYSIVKYQSLSSNITAFYGIGLGTGTQDTFKAGVDFIL